MCMISDKNNWFGKGLRLDLPKFYDPLSGEFDGVFSILRNGIRGGNSRELLGDLNSWEENSSYRCSICKFIDVQFV